MLSSGHSDGYALKSAQSRAIGVVFKSVVVMFMLQAVSGVAVAKCALCTITAAGWTTTDGTAPLDTVCPSEMLKVYYIQRLNRSLIRK